MTAVGPYDALEADVLEWISDGCPEFDLMILRIFRFQRERCRSYQAYCAKYRDPTRWQEIPAIPASAFRQFAIRSFPAEKTIRTFRTSGTTSETFGEHHFCSLTLYHSVAIKGWRDAGLPTDEIFALMPPASEAPHSSLSQMASWLTPRERFFFGKWPELVRALGQAQRPVLFGTALAFLDFFQWLGKTHSSLPPGSVAIETGGYKGTRRSMPKEELYGLFERKLGLSADSLWNEYGMTELSSQFYTRGLGQPHRFPPWTRVLVVNAATGGEVAEGETGLLRIYDAANLGSVCALQTRDLAIRRGMNFELVGRDPSALPRGCSRAADEEIPHS